MQIEITCICKQITKYLPLFDFHLWEPSFMGLIQLQFQKLLELFWNETEKVWYNDIDDDDDNDDNDDRWSQNDVSFPTYWLNQQWLRVVIRT